jgi:uncharacterized protein (DUF305 family)
MEKRLLSLGVLTTLLVLGLVLAGCGGGNDEGGNEGVAASAVPFDRAFIDAMVPHHQSAIEMARAAKAAGLSQADLVGIADNIIATQQVEIDQMLQWREQWFGTSELDPNGMEALGLSESEMGIMPHGAEELTDAGDIDQAFAEMMTAHHQGAITMASLAQDQADHAEIKELAADIIQAQEGEIEIMKEHAQAMNHS